MSRRESQIPQPVSLRTVAGVNQRVRATELPLHQFPQIEGVFPEFAGLQSRVWGKRLLQKYAEAIYGIHQFWTPMGYGAGLYQFDGKLDYGQWLTPVSDFTLTIPPIGIDGGGMTLDEFGLPYGSNFGYGTDNACEISFLDGSTDHSSCMPPPTPANTPNDSNGGPAGGGRKCVWEEGVQELPLLGFVTRQQFGGYSNQQTWALFTDNCRNDLPAFCVPFPPLPTPLGSAPDPVFADQTPDGVLSATLTLTSGAFFIQPSNLACTFAVNQTQTVSQLLYKKITINLESLLDDESITQAVLVMMQNSTHEIEVPLSLTPGDQLLVAKDHLVMQAQVPNGNSGYNQTGTVSGNVIRLYGRRRHCVPA